MATLTERTLVIGHRGAPGALCGVPGAVTPENTMPAFELAAEQHADGVETDVHFSKDGRIMIIHDAKIDRTTNGQGLITDYTYDELCVFDAGIKTGPEFKNVRIPTVDELLALCRRTGMILNIEIKSADPAMPAALHELVKKYGMADATIYSSFDHEQLMRMLRIDPADATNTASGSTPGRSTIPKRHADTLSSAATPSSPTNPLSFLKR